MNAAAEQALISKIRTLSQQQLAEVEDFVEFLAAKSKKYAALDRLLAIAPALEAAGVEPMSEDEIAAEVKAARVERRARQAAKDSGASYRCTRTAAAGVPRPARRCGARAGHLRGRRSDCLEWQRFVCV
jgi:hypothetical protein